MAAEGEQESAEVSAPQQPWVLSGLEPIFFLLSVPRKQAEHFRVCSPLLCGLPGNTIEVISAPHLLLGL